MKIYINENYEIKAINSTDDKLLEEIEIDRDSVFENKSDFMILNYCYKQDENGYSIYPSRNYSDIVEEDYRIKVDELQKKLSNLSLEIEELKKENQVLREGLFMLLSEEQLMKLGL